jgi:trk system potassium uptake protein TrkA
LSVLDELSEGELGVPQARVGAADRVTVIGLGRFGTSVARTLHELGYDVTAIDLDERRVQEASEFVTLAAQGDGADEETLRSLDVDASDVGIVAQGESLEASLTSTLVLKRLGVKLVVAKALSELQGELLQRVGADRVIYPERDAGVRLAHSLAVPHINDYIPLTATGGVAKLAAPGHFAGQTLAELYGRHEADLTVLLIRRGDAIIASPSDNERIKAGDELVVAGSDQAIEGFAETYPEKASQ